MPIQALFFDVGNTLLFPNRQRMLHALHTRSIFPAEDLLKSIERDTKHEFDALLEAHSAVDRGFWELFYARLARELKIEDSRICDDLVARTRISANWCDIRPGTRETLLRLRQHYRLGVISNADGKIADILARCGIADCFETITDSGIVGQEKPHPGIFKAALESLAVSAEDSLYTGDVYSVDYLGAKAVGMRCVLFDLPGAYKDRGLPRVESLEELEHWLERGSEAQPAASADVGDRST
jgi:HAD superfamily hydrolase (TIGR01509 family)